MVMKSSSFDKLKTVAVSDEEKALFYNALAAALNRAGYPAEAEKADLAALALKRPAYQSIIRQALRLSRQNKTEEAVSVTSRLSSYPGVKSQQAILLSDIYRHGGHQDRALSVLASGLKASPDNLGIIRQLARAYQQMGEHEKAVETIEKLRGLSTNAHERALAVEAEGDIENIDGNMHLALSKYRQASAIVPDNVRILKKLLAVSKKTGNRLTELNTLKRLIIFEPDNRGWAEAIKNIEKNIEKRQIFEGK
jgi:tetratricopeptide (TPR) repeat protein